MGFAVAGWPTILRAHWAAPIRLAERDGYNLSETIMNLQSYDLLMVLVLAGATLFGFWKGMAWQLASLASLVVSYFVALKFSAQLAPMFGQPPTNRFIAMLTIFSGTSFVVWMLFRFVSGIIDKIKLQAFDKEMGALFGLAKGVLLCVAITFFAVSSPLPQEQRQAIANSRSGHYIVALLNKAETMVPPEYHQQVVPILDKVEEQISTGNPNGQGLQLGWPGSPAGGMNSATPGSWPQIGWPPVPAQSGQPQNGWPQWPTTSQPSSTQPAWPTQTPQQMGWPSQSQAQPAWPTQQSSDAQAQPGWPTQQAGQMQMPTSANAADPYSVPREPNPFPDPNYSAERPTGGAF
jgi:membrane protein required for colicin V production